VFVDGFKDNSNRITKNNLMVNVYDKVIAISVKWLSFKVKV